MSPSKQFRCFRRKEGAIPLPAVVPAQGTHFIGFIANRGLLLAAEKEGRFNRRERFVQSVRRQLAYNVLGRLKFSFLPEVPQ